MLALWSKSLGLNLILCEAEGPSEVVEGLPSGQESARELVLLVGQRAGWAVRPAPRVVEAGDFGVRAVVRLSLSSTNVGLYNK